MFTKYRDSFNQTFSHEKYKNFLQLIKNGYGEEPTFRISETPIFIPVDLKNKLIDACSLLDQYLLSESFKQDSQKALEKIGWVVPNEDKNTTFIQYDFGIIKNEQGELFPQLIEMQGFPSLYLFQSLLTECFVDAYQLPKNLSPYFGGLDRESYLDHLKKIIVDDANPKNTVLLEVEPEKQNTKIDFVSCSKVLGIKILDLKDLKKSGRSLYYEENGKKIDVQRIYNRVIFDELNKRPDLFSEFDFRDEVDAFWVGHPNWFYRISKYAMPFIKNNPYIPETKFLSDFQALPLDLENYVLKPLFSFSGDGVKFHVTLEDIHAVKDPENWILQRKVKYEPVIRTSNADENVKVEIRMMHTWAQGDKTPKLVNNLVRMSKGEMIGVKFNKNKDWIGASVGLMENNI